MRENTTQLRDVIESVCEGHSLVEKLNALSSVLAYTIAIGMPDLAKSISMVDETCSAMRKNIKHNWPNVVESRREEQQ